MSKLKYFDGTNWKVVNGEVTGDTLPIGSMVPYGSTTAPTNWLVCDGSAVSRTTYAELFAVIGTSYGAGDGTTTFNLPNKKGRSSVGYDSTDTDFNAIGKKGGSKELQEHFHSGIYSNYGGELTSFAQSGSDAVYDLGNLYQTSKSKNSTIQTTTAGTGQSGNLSPYETDCWIIKAFQSAGVIANVSGAYSESEADVYNCVYVNNKLSGIIESSGNANGYYTKYADGTLICRGFAGPITVNGYTGATRNVTFPYSFIDTNWSGSLTKTAGGAYWSWIVETMAGKATTGFTINLWNNYSEQSSGIWYDYIIIGRWK